MNRHLLLLATFFMAIALNAQIDPRYDKGAVPEVDGKIIFTKNIVSDPKLSDQELFEKVKVWADKNYNQGKQREKQRVLLTDEDKKQVACSGDMLLVFGRKLLSFDSSPMYYQLIMQIEDGKCEATVRNIRYIYNEGHDNEEAMTAEETISDKVAINKKGTKLNFFYEKFRRVTIDSLEQVFTSLEKGINDQLLASTRPVNKEIQYVYIDKSTGNEVEAPTTAQPVKETPQNTVSSHVATPMPMPIPTPATKMEGFKKVTAQDIPKDFIKLLEKPTLVTITKDGKAVAATWAGTNNFFGKQVSMIIMNSQAAAANSIEAGDTYTISFFTSASRDALAFSKDKGLIDAKELTSKGLYPVATEGMTIAYNEASIVIECRKITDQSLSNATSEMNEYKSDIPAEWQKAGTDKLYFNVGEILNVWVK